MVLIQVRKFENILGQIKVISQEQNQIAHELLVVKNRLFQHIKNNLLGRKIVSGEIKSGETVRVVLKNGVIDIEQVS